ncbi:MAG: electron transport complex subunit RsxA [Clostridiales bacterium]|jgi:electron transport complex protein RnfA|nr:electron transport complex subunit RsxA [Clostridiales bacterium]
MIVRDLGIIALSTILVHNFVLSQFLGICPFLGVSKKLDTALGMSGAVIFVMTVASAVTWLVNRYLLAPNSLAYMQTISFILVIAALVQFIEILMKKFMPPLYNALGIYLPLITTNCAVLGVALLNMRDYPDSLARATVHGLAGGLGFMLALVLFAGVRERLELCDVPECLEGLPITLISAGLVSLSFFGFQGLFA